MGLAAQGYVQKTIAKILLKRLLPIGKERLPLLSRGARRNWLFAAKVHTKSLIGYLLVL